MLIFIMASKFSLVCVEDGRLRLLPAGFTNDDVEATELPHGVGHKFLAERLPAQITGLSNAGPTGIPNDLEYFTCEQTACAPTFAFVGEPGKMRLR